MENRKSQQQRNILLIEDNALFAKTILHRVKKANPDYYIPEHAMSLKDGLKKLSEKDFDLILLDLNLPDSSELETLQAVKKVYPKIPVIILTGLDDKNMAMEAVHLGAQEFLVKTEIESKPFAKAIHYAIERQALLNQLNSKTEELISSESRFRNIIEKSLDGIVIIDKECNTLYVNPTCEKLLGKKSSELLGTNFIFCPTESGNSGKVNFQTPSGQEKIAELRSVEIEWSGKPVFLCTLRDVTEQLAMREKEAELKKIINTSPVITFLWKAEEDWPVEFVSDNICQYGYTPEDFYSGKVKYSDMIYEDDLYKVEAEVKFYHQKGLKEYTQEYRIKTKNNKCRWINDHTWVRKDEEGKTTHFQGVIFDIEDRKAAEDALMKAEKEKATILSSISELVMYVDINLNILWANKAANERIKNNASRLENILCSSLWHGKKICKNCPLVNNSLKRFEEEIKLLPDGTAWSVRCYPVLNSGVCEGAVVVAQDITEQRKAEAELRQIHTAIEEAMEAIIITDLEGRATYMNRAFTDILGYTFQDLSRKNIYSIYVDDEKSLEEERNSFLALHTEDKWKGWQCKTHVSKANGQIISALIRATPIPDKNDIPVGMLFIITDMSIHEKEENEKKQLQLQLTQSQKLESIGQLAAGIAHEINTPTQFVGDNTNFLKDSFQGIVKILDAHQELLEKQKEDKSNSELIAKIEKLIEEEDIEYLKEEIPEALDQSLNGIKRISDIVLAMKEFSHPSADEKKAVDINKAIENTLTVSRNEWKYVADLETEYSDQSPMVNCLPGELNQVFLNMFVNAAHSIADANKEKSSSKGVLKVKTERSDTYFKISISDTGTGIPEEIRPRIFDMFFTTKGVGKGTGQGLALAYDVIVNKHGGRLTFDSEVGKGTTFHIELPLDDNKE
jgi:PAS domain S-box-containing protein